MKQAVPAAACARLIGFKGSMGPLDHNFILLRLVIIKNKLTAGAPVRAADVQQRVYVRRALAIQRQACQRRAEVAHRCAHAHGTHGKELHGEVLKGGLLVALKCEC